MKKTILGFFIPVLFFAAKGEAGVLLVQTASATAVRQTDTAGQAQDVNNPENTLPTEQQQESPQSAYFGKKTDRPVSAHKVNYFSINHWPANSAAQVKFQISMKFRLLEPDLKALKHNLFPAYIGYTQKSLWNEGRKSMPFEETDHNPEFFLDYPANSGILGRLKLRNIVVCPIEHESNGLEGPASRSWNRQYIMIKLGFESKEKLEIANSLLADKASLSVRFWLASGYSDENAYLVSHGDHDSFLDYMGRGEAVLSVRNFLWGGSLKNHQLDIRTPIFRDSRKRSYEFSLRQQLPRMNFALFLQYWYGYGETLLRFDQFGHRGFAGFSFSY